MFKLIRRLWQLALLSAAGYVGYIVYTGGTEALDPSIFLTNLLGVACPGPECPGFINQAFAAIDPFQ
ncbi:MAG: hypothetical protein AAGJ96_06480 [Pseudomonadota bacterium]